MAKSKLFFLSLENARVDDASGTIHGVSLISKGEAKGHDCFVDDTTLLQVFYFCKKSATLKVKADHGSGVFSTVGYLDNFSLHDDKVLGDLHIYDSEPQRDRLFEIAQKNPTHMGLSLEFTGKDEKIDGKNFARCEELFTAALVSDPAANKSLFDKENKTKPVDTKENVMANENTPDPKKDPKDDPMQTILTRLDEMDKRMQKYEDKDAGVTPDADKKKIDPPVTDPSTQPKAQDKDLEDGDKKTDAKDDEKIAKAVEMGVEAAIRKLSAGNGIKLPAAGAAEIKTDTEKKFSELVDEKAKELGCKNKAMVFCIKNHPKEYAASRLVATR